jgi:pimeloyl-ACP methyl ester carboxylesterase
MDRALIHGVELEYEVHGTGEPVLLVHPGIFSDWFVPLLNQSVLASRFQLLHYHRVGCRNSSRIAGPVSLMQQATHARALLEHLGVARAHVVGHSSSGNIVLQLAAQSPDAVQSLVVMEPALMSVPSAATSRVFVGEAVQRYCAGDRAGAVDLFLRGTCGPHYRVALDHALPGAFDRYVEDASTFFEQELPALQQWGFGDIAAQVTQPALAVVGARSLEMDPIWRERHELLLRLLTDVTPCVIPGTTHLLQVENPVAIARHLSDFLTRHPL